MRNPRKEWEQRECDIYYHPLATLSSQSKGRIRKESKDKIRTDFERDGNRILHCFPFRRLRHKTQVFFSPKSDHVCTRLEHSLYVASISSTVARCLGLNVQLVDAIAKGHDLGHPPFGHHGETVFKKEIDKNFHHELHGLRVVDKVAKLPDYDRVGLNLTFEVRDGIVSHYGERIDKRLTPDRNKKPRDLYKTKVGQSMPATLEGCVVRMVDKVAYLGRDIEDAKRAGLIKKEDIPRSINKKLGRNNKEIIGTLVSDIVANNHKDYESISLSPKVHQAALELFRFNYAKIYRHPEVARYSKYAHEVLVTLYNDLNKHLQELPIRESGNPKHKDKLSVTFRSLHDFIQKTKYTQREKSFTQQIIIDYLAGMTDNFVLACFEELHVPKPMV